MSMMSIQIEKANYRIWNARRSDFDIFPLPNTSCILQAEIGVQPCYELFTMHREKFSKDVPQYLIPAHITQKFKTMQGEDVVLYGLCPKFVDWRKPITLSYLFVQK
jgi:hypothetical protein